MTSFDSFPPEVKQQLAGLRARFTDLESRMPPMDTSVVDRILARLVADDGRPEILEIADRYAEGEITARDVMRHELIAPLLRARTERLMAQMQPHLAELRSALEKGQST